MCGRFVAGVIGSSRTLSYVSAALHGTRRSTPHACSLAMVQAGEDWPGAHLSSKLAQSARESSQGMHEVMTVSAGGTTGSTWQADQRVQPGPCE